MVSSVMGRKKMNWEERKMVGEGRLGRDSARVKYGGVRGREKGKKKRVQYYGDEE